MIPRQVATEVEEALDRQAAVALIGARQVGKTTLALEVGKRRNAVYLDLEDPDDRAKLSAPRLFFESHEDRLIILDEIHRMPDIFATLRGVIDRARRLWLRGGLPDAYLAVSDTESPELRKVFIRTYLERDVPMFGSRVPAASMQRLWTLLAHGQGSLLNASQLARSLEVSPQSVTRYVDLLCDQLGGRRSPPLQANAGKRLVKSPKVFVRDNALVHALLGLETVTQLLGQPVVGQGWEGFVIETLLRGGGWSSQASFYRTSAGRRSTWSSTTQTGDAGRLR